MLILWTLLVTAAAAHKVFESTEDIGPEAFQNVTTLYPVPHHPNNSDNKTINKTTHIDNNVDKTTDIVKNVDKNEISDDNNAIANDTDSKEDKSKLDATIWKIDAAFSDSNLNDGDEEKKGNVTEKKNVTKEFRPSQHLGNFYDEDNFRVSPTRASFESFTPVKKPAGFLSSKDDFRSSFTKIPKQIFETHKQFPYKFESPILTRLKDPWKDRPDNLESKPTVEVPVKVPAGGFYKYEDPFRERPRNQEDQFREKPGKDEEDFGLGFAEDGKDVDSAVKKRVNPWEQFLRLVTAFLPVGLIISALTPSLVTIENGPTLQGNTYPTNLFRRSDPAASELPVISERCRRRLLCELHSENNYSPTTSHEPSLPRRGRACYKIRCEDSDAIARMLSWLLEYRRTTQNGHYT